MIMRVAVTGGGSGGHLSPALAVIQKIKELRPDAEVLYIGGRLSMEGARQSSIEQRVLPKTDIPHIFIHAGKLQRRWRLSTVFLLWGAIPGFFEALYNLRKFKPQVIFSTGGFVSVPVIFAAWLLQIPIIIHEQTATVGLANRIGARFAHEVMVSFPSSARHFPAGKVTVSGNPIRSEVLAVVHKRQKREYPRAPFLIYITGGAQGSHLINQVVAEALPQLLKKYRVIHQCGDNRLYNDYSSLSQKADRLEPHLHERYQLFKYIDVQDIGEVFFKADLVIGRAGANTVNEITALGIPAIFIPIPWVTNNEQYKNARILVNTGSAIILEERRLSAESLLKTVGVVIAGYAEYYERAQQARVNAKLKAAELLAKRILQYAGM